MGAPLMALPSGGLIWPDEGLLVVADLHLGRSERTARRGGAFLPPYETLDTLTRLHQVIEDTDPRTVICLGDSFDDDAAADALTSVEQMVLKKAMGPRRWIWAEGNHDPSAETFGGERAAEIELGPLRFRHIAAPGAPDDGTGEVSAHYHPKAALRGAGTRPCFLVDRVRVVMPAFGTYTGGLASTAPALSGLMGEGALAILTSETGRALPMPMPRGRARVA